MRVKKKTCRRKENQRRRRTRTRRRRGGASAKSRNIYTLDSDGKTVFLSRPNTHTTFIFDNFPRGKDGKFDLQKYIEDLKHTKENPTGWGKGIDTFHAKGIRKTLKKEKK